MIDLTPLNALLVTGAIVVWMLGLTFALIGLACLVEKIAHR